MDYREFSESVAERGFQKITGSYLSALSCILGIVSIEKIGINTRGAEECSIRAESCGELGWCDR